MTKKIALACVECGLRNYSTTGSKHTSGERLIIKKYCKKCNKHTNHKETI